MTTIDRDLFKIFHENKDRYDLYTAMLSYVNKAIKDAKGEENREFYNTLTTLLNSINNAGCEERRSEQIRFIWDAQGKISDAYEDYLC